MDRKPVPWWIGAIVALIALILILQPSLAKQVENYSNQLFAPVASAANGVSNSISDFWRTITSIGILHQTVQRQQEEIDRLNFELIRMNELEQENEDLRRLLEFKRTRPDLKLLPVRVLGTDATGMVDTIVIDKGANDGIEEDMAVITWRGLVGRVIQVTPVTSYVLLITDVNSSIAVRVQDPASRASGIVTGRKEGGLLMKHILQQELIQTGDLVITSGVGGSLPQGLPVGTVVRVQKRNVEMFQEALLEPSADTTKLERLYAVLDFPKY
ncbi:MAG: rod shape-determining protein MreC [Chloroflexota bacterium]